MHCPHRLHQFSRIGGFQNIATSPGLEQGKNVRVVIVSGQDQHRHFRVPGLDAPRGLDAADAGHLDVEHRHVGLMFGHQGNSLVSIAGFSYHRDVTFFLQEFANAFAYYGMVIGQNHTDRLDISHRFIFPLAAQMGSRQAVTSILLQPTTAVNSSSAQPIILIRHLAHPGAVGEQAVQPGSNRVK